VGERPSSTSTNRRKEKGGGLAAPSALLLAPIHRNAWKGYSANFAQTAVSEICRKGTQRLATRQSKDTPYGRCIAPSYPPILVSLATRWVSKKALPSTEEGVGADSEHREENHHRGSSKDRRAAATKDHKRHPSSRGRRSQGLPTQSGARSRLGGQLRSLPRCHGLPRRAGRVARRHEHDLRRRCWRPTSPRLPLLLLYQAGAGDAGRIAYTRGDIHRASGKELGRALSRTCIALTHRTGYPTQAWASSSRA
jgi:hypothetical protein